MRYAGMPLGMWALFASSFKKQLSVVYGYNAKTAKVIIDKAKPKYKRIIEGLPTFEKTDQFKMNIVNCAMLSAILLSLPKKPSVEKTTEYYRASMMTAPMKWFCRISGKKKFSEQDIQNMKDTATLRAADKNPYSWNMEYLPYPDGSGYEARFTSCGISTLMRELGLFELVPAMCRLDYSMSEASGVSEFVREYTLASGGPYCDCGYKKKSEADYVSY